MPYKKRSPKGGQELLRLLAPVRGADGAALARLGASAAAAAEGFVDGADDLLAIDRCAVRRKEHVVEALAVLVEDSGEGFRDLAEALGECLGLLRRHVGLEEDEFRMARLCRGRMRLHLLDAVFQELARALRQALAELLLLLLQACDAIRQLRLLDGQEV